MRLKVPPGFPLPIIIKVTNNSKTAPTKPNIPSASFFMALENFDLLFFSGRLVALVPSRC
jgi:hypothetical protein